MFGNIEPAATVERQQMDVFGSCAVQEDGE
jgi:hypothetical protein